MVLVMTTSYFPADKSEEVGKKYIEMQKKFPPDRNLSKLILRVGVRITSDGMKGITISEVKEGKFDEYMKRAYEQYLEWTKLGWYKLDMEVFLTGTAAMPLVGLAMPE